MQNTREMFGFHGMGLDPQGRTQKIHFGEGLVPQNFNFCIYSRDKNAFLKSVLGDILEILGRAYALPLGTSLPLGTCPHSF